MKQKRKVTSLFPSKLSRLTLSALLIFVGGLLCLLSIGLLSFADDVHYNKGIDDKEEVLYHMYFFNLGSILNPGKVVGDMGIKDNSTLFISGNPIVVPGSTDGNQLGEGNNGNILGGKSNTLKSDGVTMVAGFGNSVKSGNDNATVLGGNSNEVEGNNNNPVLLGGSYNVIRGDNDTNLIAGGDHNLILSGSSNVNMLGGTGNVVKSSDVIVGGSNISVGGDANDLFVFSDGNSFFSLDGQDKSRAFYLKVFKGLGINSEASRGGVESGGPVSLGEIDIQGTCKDNNIGVQGVWNGCLVGCTYESKSQGKWELLDRGEKCNNDCKSNNAYCIVPEPNAVPEIIIDGFCTKYDIYGAHQCSTGVEKNYTNVVFETMIRDFEEGCLDSENKCVFHCPSGTHLYSGGCYKDCTIPGVWTIRHKEEGNWHNGKYQCNDGELILTDCDSNYHTEGNKESGVDVCEPNTKTIDCNNLAGAYKPNYSDFVPNPVQIEWKGVWNNGVWTDPICEWSCWGGYHYETGSNCVANVRTVPCTTGGWKPDNSVYVEKYVTEVWKSGNGGTGTCLTGDNGTGNNGTGSNGTGTCGLGSTGEGWEIVYCGWECVTITGSDANSYHRGPDGNSCISNINEESCGGGMNLPLYTQVISGSTFTQRWNGSGWNPEMLSWNFGTGICGIECISGYYLPEGGESCKPKDPGVCVLGVDIGASIDGYSSHSASLPVSGLVSHSFQCNYLSDGTESKFGDVCPNEVQLFNDYMTGLSVEEGYQFVNWTDGYGSGRSTELSPQYNSLNLSCGEDLYLRWTCASGYVYEISSYGSGSATTAKCVKAECKGSLSSGGIINNNSIPDNNTTEYFCDETSTNACSYHCPEGSRCKSDKTGCEPLTRTGECMPLPDNALGWVNGNGTFVQTILSGVWSPESKRTCVSVISAAGPCSFNCREGYKCSSDRQFCDAIGPLECQEGKPVKVAGMSIGSDTHSDYSNPSKKWTYISGATSLGACEWTCDGEHYDPNISEKTCNPKSFPCGETGKPVASGCVVLGSETYLYGLVASTGWTYTGAANPGACAWTCEAGCHQDGDTCKVDVYSCKNNRPKSEGVIWGQSPKNSSEVKDWIYTGSKQPGVCEWTCGTGYYQNRTGCELAKIPCSGSIKMSSGMRVGDNEFLYSDTLKTWTYVSGATSLGACEWTCEDVYYKPDLTKNTCVYNTRSSRCEDIDENVSSWTLVSGHDYNNSTFTQTWNGSGWNPSNQPNRCVTQKYSNMSCSFVCNEDYECDPTDNNHSCRPKNFVCGGNKPKGYGSEGTGLKLGRSPKNSSEVRDWTYVSGATSLGVCEWTCESEHYELNLTGDTCIPKSKNISCGTLQVENAEKWLNSRFTQKWIPERITWSPAVGEVLNCVDGSQSDKECSFKCKDGFKCSGSECVQGPICKNWPDNPDIVENNKNQPKKDTNYYYSDNTDLPCTFRCKEKELCGTTYTGSWGTGSAGNNECIYNDKINLKYDCSNISGYVECPKSVQVTIGESVTLSEPTKKSGISIIGWQFLGWSTNKNETNTNNMFKNYTAGCDGVTLYPNFRKRVSVRYMARGNSLVLGDKVSDTMIDQDGFEFNFSGVSLQVPEVQTKDGFEFIGWADSYLDYSANDRVCEIVDENYDKTKGTYYISPSTDTKVLYPLYKKKVTLTFDPNGNGGEVKTVSKDRCDYECSWLENWNDKPPVFTPYSGFTRIGWTQNSKYKSDQDIRDRSVSDSPRCFDNDQTWYAHSYKDETKIVAFSPNGNSGFVYNSKTYRSKISVELCTSRVYDGDAYTCDCGYSDTVTMPTIIASTNTPEVIGWSFAPDQHDADYLDGATVNLRALTGCMIDLYAQTKRSEEILKVKFNGNENPTVQSKTLSCTGETIYNGDASWGCEIISPVINAPTNTPSVIGWSTGSDRHVNDWKPGSKKSITKNMGTYYAQTKKDKVNKSVTLDGNGGTWGTQPQKTYTCTIDAVYNNALQPSYCETEISKPTYDTHELSGWSLYKDGQADRSIYDFNTNTFKIEGKGPYYAVWKIDGICGDTHYGCEAGESVGNQYNAILHQYTWKCKGKNGGDETSCIENSSEDGECNNSVVNGCTKGKLNDIADTTTQYLWQCLGINGGRSVDCSKCIPINGVCNNDVVNGCATGTLNDTTDTSTQYKWQCVGSCGGRTVSCSKCIPINGVCNNNVENGCTEGKLNNIADTTTEYKWQCVGSCGGGTDNCSKCIPINGVCNNDVVNGCATGTLNDTTDTSTQYKWQCVGSCGGRTVSCSKDIPLEKVDGQCDNDVVNGCKKGKLNDIADTTTQYKWQCLGINGGTSEDCSKCIPINGVCNNNVENGCTEGTLNNIADTTTEYKWQCVGSCGGGTDNCSKAKPIDGECNNDVVNGCKKGTLNNIADTTTEYKWQCIGSNGGGTDNCSKCIPINGVCNNNVENGCTEGTLNNIADTTTEYKWQCVGSCGGETVSCSKTKPIINGECNNDVVNGCKKGTLNDIADTTTEYKWQCVGSNGGGTANCSKGIPINGVCKNGEHYVCTAGRSTNNNYDESTYKYTWDCEGINGGTTATDCYELAVGNAECSSEIAYECKVGYSTNQKYNKIDYKWTWDCKGINGGTDASCSINEIKPGECSEKHYNCEVGTSKGGEYSNRKHAWIWQCEGINGGKTESCEETPNVCFPAGTDVAMADGTTKNIENIQKGDVVVSYNTDTNANESSVVEQVIVHEDSEHEMYELTINGNVLRVTEAHPFYVRKSDENNSLFVLNDFKLGGVYLFDVLNIHSLKNYHWVEAKDLKVGDRLLMIDGSSVEIEKIDHYSNKETVYNLEVADNHDYFVNQGYLVHNKGNGCSCGQMQKVFGPGHPSNPRYIGNCAGDCLEGQIDLGWKPQNWYCTDSRYDPGDPDTRANYRLRCGEVCECGELTGTMCLGSRCTTQYDTGSSWQCVGLDEYYNAYTIDCGSSGGGGSEGTGGNVGGSTGGASTSCLGSVAWTLGTCSAFHANNTCQCDMNCKPNSSECCSCTGSAMSY